MSAEELRFDAGGLGVAGQGWGPKDGRPVIAFHGWLDNAASFATLGPLLEGCRVVALDMPGHGLSDPRSPDASYNLWDDLPQIEGVLDALGWEQVVFLGHSRGAMQALLSAATMADRAHALVTLDGLVPRPTAPERSASQLARFLHDRKRYAARADRVFESIAAFVERRREFGLTDAQAEILATRALEPVPEGYRLRGDPRLMGASAVKFDAAQIEGVLSAVKTATLCLWAEEGLRARDGWKDEVDNPPEARISGAEAVTLPGDHHFHMTPEHAREIARRILAFL